MSPRTRHYIYGGIAWAMFLLGLWVAICLALRGHG